MGLKQKLKRILVEAFPPPSKITLKDHDGLVAIVTSATFRDLDAMERQDLLQEVLQKHGITSEEMKRILILVAVTPEEEEAYTAVD